MAGYIHGPLTYTWMLLSGAALVSWWLGANFPLVVLLIAVIKCRIVMRSYMEVGRAPRWLQLTCDGWLALNLAMTSSFYWFAS